MYTQVFTNEDFPLKKKVHNNSRAGKVVKKENGKSLKMFLLSNNNMCLNNTQLYRKCLVVFILFGVQTLSI